MSTRGSFMICRDGACKEMVIRYDAYPQGAGMDVVDLIKTKDLKVLYESMRIDRECGESAADFRYECCKAGGREDGYLPVRSGPEYFIQHSLFCEYGYVVDLDRQTLELYVGGQTSPQEDNRFGTESARNEFADKTYYPCRMKAAFSFDYVRDMDAECVILQMEEAENAENGLCYETADGEATDHKLYADALEKLSELLFFTAEWLTKEAKLILDVEPACKKRVDELQADCREICEAVAGLQKRRRLLRRDKDV